jgi:hypothetical protein
MWILLFAAPSSSSSSSTELYLQNSHQDKNKSKDFQTKIELKMLRSDSRLIAIANPNGVKSIHSANASIGQLIFSLRLSLSLHSVSLPPWAFTKLGFSQVSCID